MASVLLANNLILPNWEPFLAINEINGHEAFSFFLSKLFRPRGAVLRIGSWAVALVFCLVKIPVSIYEEAEHKKCHQASYLNMDAYSQSKWKISYSVLPA